MREHRRDNTDQGSQFTSEAFTGVLIKNGVAISWTARAHGATTFLSNGSGAASNMKKFICEPMAAFATPALRSFAISTSIMGNVLILPLTGAHRTRPTSIQRPAWRRHEFFRRRGLAATTVGLARISHAMFSLAGFLRPIFSSLKQGRAGPMREGRSLGSVGFRCVFPVGLGFGGCCDAQRRRASGRRSAGKPKPGGGEAPFLGIGTG
jgi:hypothetical protein